MNRRENPTSRRTSSFRLLVTIIAMAAFAFIVVATRIPSARAQAVPEATSIRIGERLTYNVSIGRFSNAAYAELWAVSRGRLSEKDAIEIRAKFKTLDLASAAFYMIDENRTTFIAPSTGLPLFTSVTQNAFGLPKETTQNFLVAPTPHADLLSMIYKLRHSGGTGSLTMQDGEKVYSVTFQSGVVEKQKTDVGDFETTVISVQSEYFTEHGMTNVRVNLSTDEARLPVLIRFKTAKGNVRAGLSSVQMIEPEVTAQPTATPGRTPLPERTPRPVVTPTPFINNQPLTPELAFDLGERLVYRISTGGQQVAMMNLWAKERKQFNGMDSLVLEATFSDFRPGSPFAGGDFVRVHVNPETLAPREMEMKFAGALRSLSGRFKFEREGSVITIGTKRIDAPVGTHSLLSLIYAARSFNLKPSRDLNNPINDTRVAVFWESDPYIFTLRPSAPEVLTIEGKQVAAQLVNVGTKNAVLDRLNIKMWLGNDESRVPVRFVVGTYQADLVSSSNILPN